MARPLWEHSSGVAGQSRKHSSRFAGASRKHGYASLGRRGNIAPAQPKCRSKTVEIVPSRHG